MSRRSSTGIAGLVLIALVSGCGPESSIAVTEVKPGLLARATFSPEAAFTVSQAQRPNGAVVDAEIDEERGRLVYEFAIVIDGVEGMDEVQIDATTGEIVSIEHESAEEMEDDDESEGSDGEVDEDDDDDEPRRDTGNRL